MLISDHLQQADLYVRRKTVQEHHSFFEKSGYHYICTRNSPRQALIDLVHNSCVIMQFECRRHLVYRRGV